MINQELFTYIKEQVAAGVDRAQITNILLGNGWTHDDINLAFEALNPKPQVPTPPEVPQIQKQEKQLPTYSSMHDHQNPPSRNILGKILIAIAIVIIIGLGAALALQYLKETPEQVLAKAEAQAAELNDIAYSGNIVMDIDTHTEFMSPTNISIEASGVVRNIRSDMPASSISIQASTNLIELTESTGKDRVSLNLDLKNLNNKMYLRIEKLPEVPFFDLSSLNNVWVEFDLGDLEEEFGVDQTEIPQQESLKQLFSLFQKDDVLTLSSVEENIMFNSIPVHHYTFAVNENAFLETMKETNPDINKEDYQDFTMSPLELWIGKEDYVIYKISSEVSFSILDGADYKMSFDINFSPLNEIPEIIAPENPDSIESIMERMFDPEGEFYSEEEFDDLEYTPVQ